MFHSFCLILFLALSFTITAWADDCKLRFADLDDTNLKPFKDSNNTPVVYENPALFSYLARKFETAFREPNFYSALVSHPEVVKKLYSNWYYYQKKIAPDILLSTLGPKVFPLILDPGIRYRMNDFLRFAAQANPEKKLSAFELRELYSKHLGTTVAYRGMRISRDQLEQLKAKGFPNYNPKHGGSNDHYAFRQFMSRGPNGDAKARNFKEDVFVLSQSYTNRYRLAKGFAMNDKTKFDNALTAPIVISSEIPRLDLIDRSMVPFGGKTLADLIMPFAYFPADGKKFWWGGEGLEYYLFGNPDPKWIKKMEEVSGPGLPSSQP